VTPGGLATASARPRLSFQPTMPCAIGRGVLARLRLRELGAGDSRRGQQPRERTAARGWPDLTRLRRSLPGHPAARDGTAAAALREPDRRDRNQARGCNRNDHRSRAEPDAADGLAARRGWGGGEAPGPTRPRPPWRAVVRRRWRSVDLSGGRLDRTVDGCGALSPEIVGARNGLLVLTRACAGSHRDELLRRPNPVTWEPDDVLCAVSACAIRGLPIIRFHGFAAPFRLGSHPAASSGAGSITLELVPVCLN
jgi:hypothetical protein